MRRTIVSLLLVLGVGCWVEKGPDDRADTDRDSGERFDAVSQHNSDTEEDAEIYDSGIADQYVGDAKIDADDELEALNVLRFKDSYCKDYIFDDAQLFTGRDTWQYIGLKCIAWDLSDPERALFDLINFEDLCGFPRGEGSFWRGYAYQTERDELRLIAEWDMDGVNGCGYCLYDFSFEVEDLQFDRILNVGIATHGYRGVDHKLVDYSTTLSVGESATGIKCRYDDFRHYYISIWDPDYWQPGELHMPADYGECGEDLTVFELGDDYEICAASCSESGDCPIEEVLTCQRGTCMPTEAW